MGNCCSGESFVRSGERVRNKSTPAFALGMAGAMAFIVCTLRGTRLRRRCGFRALDDLVALSAIEPHAPALRAEIDLNALSLRDRQRDFADGAEHAFAGCRR